MAQDFGGAYGLFVSSVDEKFDNNLGSSLEKRARDKPLSILQLNHADRAVLRIAGKYTLFSV